MQAVSYQADSEPHLYVPVRKWRVNGYSGRVDFSEPGGSGFDSSSLAAGRRSSTFGRLNYCVLPCYSLTPLLPCTPLLQYNTILQYK